MKLRTLALIALPILAVACAPVRQLNDGSYTTCKVGNPCQVGPHSPLVKPTRAMKHNKHQVVVKKVETKADGKTVVKTEKKTEVK